MMRAPAFLISALLLALPGSARADSFRPQALKQGPATSIQAYGRQNAKCLEWTDGCVICVTTGGHAQCSTPGIACTPAGLTCKRQVKP